MTQEQIDRLNAQQKNGMLHPLTCGGNRKDKNHLDGEGVLVATQDGWKCPYCDYAQAYRGGLEKILLDMPDAAEMEASFNKIMNEQNNPANKNT